MNETRPSKISTGLRQELQPQRLVSSLLVSPIHGLTEIILAISLASLIFSDQLAEYLSIGIGLALVSTILANIVTAFLAVIPGTVTGNQEVPAAIMAVIAASIVTIFSQSTSSEQLLPTVLVAIAATTFFCGISFYFLGQYRLGNIVRFLPYPVIGGFLAGTGWLLITGAIDLLTNSQPLNVLLQADVIFLWLTGLILGLVLFIVIEWVDSHFAFVGALLLAMLLFALIAWFSGASVIGLRSQGWLLESFQTEINWQPITPTILSQVDWQAIAIQFPRILTLIFVSTIALLLNISGLELTIQEESDLNSELRTAGFANMLVGLFGGLVNFPQLGLSALNHRSGARSRLPGLLGSLLVAFFLIAGSDLITLIPKLIMGGVLFFLGFTFLYDWLYRTWFTLSKMDYVILVVILLVIVTVGFLQGIAIGIIFASVMFVISYSRTDVVRHELTGKTFHSRVTRPPVERDLLISLGEQIRIFELQGFIFFGTADKLLHHVQNHIRNVSADSTTFILLDFRRTPGIDSTAMLSLVLLQKILASGNLRHSLIIQKRRIHAEPVQMASLSTSNNIDLYPVVSQVFVELSGFRRNDDRARSVR